MFKAHNIHFSYGPTTIFSGESFEFQNSEIHLIKWPNGRGKTTLLRLISGYLYCRDGEIESDGHTVSLIKPLFTLDSQTTLKHCFNIVKSLIDLRDVNFESVYNEFSRFFDLKESTPYGELSEGQRAMFFLLSILRSHSQNFIIDEFLSALDSDKRNYIYEILKDLKGQGKCIVIVDHTLNESILAQANHITL